MTIRKALSQLVSIVADEAERNLEFRRRLEDVLNARPSGLAPKPAKESTGRRSGRRTAALLDPVEIASRSTDELRARLGVLTLDQLRDIVAQFGMDPGKLVMKWKDPQRVIDRIVEVSSSRSTKGHAFRAD